MDREDDQWDKDEKYNIDNSLRILQSEHFKECIQKNFKYIYRGSQGCFIQSSELYLQHTS